VDEELSDESARTGASALAGAARIAGIGVRLRWSIAVDALGCDLRLAARSLVKAKRLTIPAVAAFALGIGANIAVFSTLDRLMFRPLPYADPGRLVQIHSFTVASVTPQALIGATFARRIASESTTFDGVAYGVAVDASTKIADLDPSPLRLAMVTANLLDTLGVRPVVGRGFTPDRDGSAASVHEILLDYGTWRARFGGSTAMFDRTYGRPPSQYRVVGVLPADFVLPSSLLLAKSDGILSDQPNQITRHAGQPGWLVPSLVARLRPGASVAQASRELEVLWQREPDSPPKVPVTPIVQPLQSGLYFLHARYLWLLIAAIGLGLAIACLNVATLLLAHGRSREREAAMCAALGATPMRIALMPLFQALLVCIAGSVVALAACAWIQPVVLAVVPPSFRPFATPAFDGRIIGLALLTACAAACVAAVVPVFALRRLDVLTIVRGRTSTVARWRGTGTLIAAEAAVAVVLATGAAVAVPGFIRLIGDPRFDPANLYELHVNRPIKPTQDEKMPAYAPHDVRAVLDAVRSAPAVLGAAVVNVALVGDIGVTDAFWQARGLDGGEWGVSDAVLDVMRTPLRAGRGFTRDEIDQRALVAMVNERAAHELWPGAPIHDVIGRSLQTADGPRAIVGVFADITRKPGETPLPGLFVPITAPESPVVQSALTVLVRTSPGRALPLDEFRARIGALGDGLRLSGAVGNIAEARLPFLQQPRFQAQLFGVLGGLGLVLAAIGLYAVTAVDVSKRQYELAVRLMLGSRPSQLRRLVLRRAGGPVLVGLALGTLATWWASRLSKSVLGMDVFAPWAIATVVIVLLAAFACACVFPARRASRVQPLVVLREL
jgi:predicted permease